MIDGLAGGYTGRYEVICPACGDDPSLSFDQVPTDLQKIRGPSQSVAGGLAAFHVRVGLAGRRANSRGSDVTGAQ